MVCSDRFAGVERHVALLAAAQLDAGKTVVVAGGDRGPMLAAMNRPALPHVEARTVLETTRQVRRLIRAADLVHVHMTASEVAAVVAAIGSDAPVVTTRHFAERRGSTPPTRVVGRWAATRMSGQIAVSRYAADAIDGRSTVVYAGVRNGPDLGSAPERRRTVLVAQRLEPEKRTDLAVQIFAAAGLGAAGWTLDVAGTGGERAQLERLAARLGVAPRVRFLGQQGDVGALMARSGILLAPCPHEAYGLSVLEGMAAGLPVVAARGGGHLETVGRVEGAALYEPGDVEAGAAALARLAADEQRRSSVAANQQRLQRTMFTIPEQERATEAVYRSVL